MRKMRKEITVKVRFEPSRIKEANLADAYEKIIPLRKENLNPAKNQTSLASYNLFQSRQKGA